MADREATIVDRDVAMAEDGRKRAVDRHVCYHRSRRSVAGGGGDGFRDTPPVASCDEFWSLFAGRDSFGTDVGDAPPTVASRCCHQ
ncbi:hypothetical protein ACLOJK_024269 [Asimina triloba]